MADNYGTPLNPDAAPAKVPAVLPKPASVGQLIDVQPPAKPSVPPAPAKVTGTPVQMAPDPAKTVVLRTVALGYSTGAEAPQLPPGMSSRGSNFIALHGGLMPRSGMTSLSTTSLQGFQVGAGWIGDSQDTTGNTFPVALSVASPLWYSNGSWSALSQTATGSANTLSDNTNTATHAYYDAVQYYHPTSDNFELCFVNADGASKPWTTRPFIGTFSTLTGAPTARYVTAFDNRLIFGYTDTPQRVSWSARGDPQTYTAPDGGFEELLDAKGIIQRVVAENDRILVFFDKEIWQGLRAPFPFTFQFSRLDNSVGVSFAQRWTVTRTPWGTTFIGSDLNPYTIPPGGTPTRLGGNAVQRLLRDSWTTTWGTSANTQPLTGYVQAYGVYAQEYDAFLMTYPTEQGTLGLMIGPEGAWSPLAFQYQGSGAQAARIRCLGTTNSTGTSSGAIQTMARVIGADTGMGRTGFSNTFELASKYTADLGSAITCQYLTVVPNPDPTQRQFVRELRMDYRATSASSLSLRLTPDFGTTYPVNTSVAMPAAPISAQTLIGTGLGAPYVGIELFHASGHTFAVQGLAAVVETTGNG